MKEPNKPDAVNPAMALRFAIEAQWRRVTDLERWMMKIFTIALLTMLLSGCSERKLVMPSESMEPTILQGSSLTIDFSAYEENEIGRGDLVCFTPSEYSEQFFVFRVAGLPNETIDLYEGTISANGIPTGIENIGDVEISPFPVTLEADEYFVVGDNTDKALDSRYSGPIIRDQIKGKVTDIQPDAALNHSPAARSE